MLVKTVFFETGDAELRYCCTRFWKVVTLRCVFEGRCHQLRYCCTKNQKLQLCEGKVTMYRVNFFKRSAWSMLTRSNPITKFIFDY